MLWADLWKSCRMGVLALNSYRSFIAFPTLPRLPKVAVFVSGIVLRWPVNPVDKYWMRFIWEGDVGNATLPQPEWFCVKIRGRILWLWYKKPERWKNIYAASGYYSRINIIHKKQYQQAWVLHFEEAGEALFKPHIAWVVWGSRQTLNCQATSCETYSSHILHELCGVLQFGEAGWQIFKPHLAWVVRDITLWGGRQTLSSHILQDFFKPHLAWGVLNTKVNWYFEEAGRYVIHATSCMSCVGRYIHKCSLIVVQPCMQCSSVSNKQTYIITLCQQTWTKDLGPHPNPTEKSDFPERLRSGVLRIFLFVSLLNV